MPSGTEKRTCEQCGGAMPSRTSRQRNEQGQLVCDSCKNNPAPTWNTTHSALSFLDQSEMKRREAQALASIVRVRRAKHAAETEGQPCSAPGCDKKAVWRIKTPRWERVACDDDKDNYAQQSEKASVTRIASLSVVAHDSGDNAIINHCPFCGSGAVVGGSNGTVTCDFCHTPFTVQVQPAHPFMPQTIDGDPSPAPGMPGDQPTEMSAPTDPTVEESGEDVAADPLGDADPSQPSNGPVRPGQPPTKQPPANQQPSPNRDEPKDKPKGGKPPWLKNKSSLHTADLSGWWQEPPKAGEEVRNATESVGYVRRTLGRYEDGWSIEADRDLAEISGDGVVVYPHSIASSKRIWTTSRDQSLTPRYSRFRTEDGRTLDADAYMARLALSFADDRDAVLDAVRADNMVREATAEEHGTTTSSWFVQGQWPKCKCGFDPHDNAALAQHYREHGFEEYDDHGQIKRKQITSAKKVDCPSCGGTGEIWVGHVEPDTNAPITRECPRCKGEGTLDADHPDNFDLREPPTEASRRTASVVKTECSSCFLPVKINDEALTLTATIPSNGVRGQGYVPAHEVTEDCTTDGDLLYWDCPRCGYADSTYATEDLRRSLGSVVPPFSHMAVEETAQSIYAKMRREGRAVLRWDQQNLIAAIRALAAKDGLKVQQYRDRPSPGMSPGQRRERPYFLSLTEDGINLVFPDAGKEAALSDGLVKQQISAGDVKVGDRLDSRGKTRVSLVHPKPPEGQVLVQTQTSGARSPSVQRWQADETITVWRKSEPKMAAVDRSHPALAGLSGQWLDQIGDDKIEEYVADWERRQSAPPPPPPPRFQRPSWLKSEPYHYHGERFGTRYFTDDGYEATPIMGRYGRGQSPSKWLVHGPGIWSEGSVANNLSEVCAAIEHGRGQS